MEARLEGLKCQLVSTGAEIEERNRLALSKQEEQINARMNDDLAKRVKGIEKRITEVQAEALGSIFHLQGNMSGKNLVSRLRDHCKAISYYSESNNVTDTRTLLKSMIKEIVTFSENKDDRIRSIIDKLDQVPSDIDSMENNEELLKIIPDFEKVLCEVKEMLTAETTSPPVDSLNNE